MDELDILSEKLTRCGVCGEETNMVNIDGACNDCSSFVGENVLKWIDIFLCCNKHYTCITCGENFRFYMDDFKCRGKMKKNISGQMSVIKENCHKCSRGINTYPDFLFELSEIKIPDSPEHNLFKKIISFLYNDKNTSEYDYLKVLLLEKILKFGNNKDIFEILEKFPSLKWMWSKCPNYEPILKKKFADVIDFSNVVGALKCSEDIFGNDEYFIPPDIMFNTLRLNRRRMPDREFYNFLSEKHNYFDFTCIGYQNLYRDLFGVGPKRNVRGILDKYISVLTNRYLEMFLDVKPKRIFKYYLENPQKVSGNAFFKIYTNYEDMKLKKKEVVKLFGRNINLLPDGTITKIANNLNLKFNLDIMECAVNENWDGFVNLPFSDQENIKLFNMLYKRGSCFIFSDLRFLCFSLFGDKNIIKTKYLKKNIIIEPSVCDLLLESIENSGKKPWLQTQLAYIVDMFMCDLTDFDF